jgi:hypothetical protein
LTTESQTQSKTSVILKALITYAFNGLREPNSRYVIDLGDATNYSASGLVMVILTGAPLPLVRSVQINPSSAATPCIVPAICFLVAAGHVAFNLTTINGPRNQETKVLTQQQLLSSPKIQKMTLMLPKS